MSRLTTENSGAVGSGGGVQLELLPQPASARAMTATAKRDRATIAASIRPGWSSPGGLLQTWDRGDHIARRELVAALFDALHVSCGQIVGYAARADREGAILKIMEALRYRVINVGRSFRNANPDQVVVGPRIALIV